MRRPMKLFLSVLVGFSIAAPAWSAPGRYIVVSIDAQGQATPVFYREVELDEREPASTSRVKSAVGDDDKLVASAGSWSEVAEVPRYLRGEFAANGISGRIQSHVVRNQDRVFALRIPASAGDALVLRAMGRNSQFSIRRIAADAQRLRLASMMRLKAAPAPSSSNRVDILVVGDGYTSAEQAKFTADAQGLRDTFQSFTPFKEYANFTNWQNLFVASSQSGADHPSYQAGCTQEGTCCADADAQNDPRAGTSVDTAFDGRFCTAQIHRLVTVDTAKVLAAASASPNWDEILVVVNDPVYGGSGGSISVVTANSSADLVAVHEFSHTFHGLADEYSSSYPGFPACSDTGGGPACEPNVTNQVTRALIKWNSWLTPGIVTPTPAGTAGVGLFQGARYLDAGMYRPMDTCGMRDLGAQFCPVCSQAYVLKLYAGGFGNPAGGIDLIEPGSESPSPAATVAYARGTTVAFGASVLRPVPDTTAMQWYLDGVAIAGANGSSYSFHQAGSSPSTHTLELRVRDNTPLVKADMAGSLLIHSRTWSIRVGAAARSDFNRDGRSDLLWRNLADGTNAIWLSASNATQQPVSAVTGMAWKMAGTGDFNGDGRADILWRNESTGANAVWYSGNAAMAQNLVSVTGTAWKIVATGDFDGDGKSDVLWRNTLSGANTIWKSANQANQQAVTGVSDLNWKIVGAGDIDGDGRSDIIWRHAASGRNTAWRSANSTLAQNLVAVTGMAWKIMGIGDYDGDGKSDLFWRNTTTGDNTYWRSGNYAARVTVTGITDMNWKIAAIGDYNGDGKDDLVWRHALHGGNVAWYSASYATRQNLVGVTNQNWRLMPLVNP